VTWRRYPARVDVTSETELQSVTFLFTDVEGSTALLERFRETASAVLSRQHELIARTVEEHGGQVFERIGDAAYAAFAAAPEAVAAATEIQDRLAAADWGEIGRLHVRVTLHTGEVQRLGDRFLGEPLFRAARLLDLTRGGEILVSGSTADLVRDTLPAEVRLRDMGTHRLRDLTVPEHLHQLVHTGRGGRSEIEEDRSEPATATEGMHTVSDESAPIRVMLVDDHMVVRRGLRGFLELIRDFDVVGEADNGREAVSAADRLQPDVILMDLVMPEMDGLTAIAAIKQAHPAIEIVAVTSFIEEEKVTQALEAGASGYLLKDADAEEVATAIRAAYNGEVHLDPAVARLLAQRMRARRTDDEPVEPLTQREKEVLAKLAKGASNKEIAYELSITERTARTHVSNILGKLGLASRTQAALYAVEHKLTDASA
jgi:DNA-binding NarL/FixJ family response regulator/class 3 adenylate cyclase